MSQQLAGKLAAVLFDAGNTILHLDYPYICEVLARHGFGCDPGAFQLAEYSSRAAVDRELAHHVSPPESVEGLLWSGRGERPSYFAVALHQLGIRGEQAEPVLEDLRRLNQERCLWRVVEPDTAEVLGELRRRGYRIAVISNADGRVERLLCDAKLDVLFETVIDSSIVGVEKPDPRIFQLALEKLGGIPAAEAIYVGDVYGIDVQGARRAGLTPILLDRLSRYPRELDCVRITALDELLDLLPGRG
ncbi:MAG TPA: HAD-IA family hydrolase [Terriglobales bacterium]|nr:HAD-IA family hydrolase [Terriglobales bacterium]